ncbi:conserved Plasmodium protein, unknown function [Plasmodium relictum]|uniref:Uncharacterized protein n=1 Tax=Plasmodium relictum TaxID=85471 RepID=A0A1J1H3Q5_PLARL|nr:conserved Plasmodium protein, unknown function [Plasmodium relictum]CRG99351.1 conserved Plasmodium protein, unknown function [Plasmodium relictum]
MSKEVLLALLQNVTTQLNDEIMEITEDINYLKNKQKITKNKRICDIVKRNYHKRKKRKYEELNEFFSKYIKFLLDKRKDYIESSTTQNLEGDQYIKKLMENINKTNISEEENVKNLKDMYQKRNILKDILRLIKSNDIKNLNYENSQNILSDLILKIKDISEINGEHCNKIANKKKSKSEINKIKNEKRINNIGKQILNYLNRNDETFSQMDESSTAPPASSRTCSNSEKASDNEQTNKSKNLKKEDFANEVKNMLLENKEEKKSLAYFNNSIQNENTKILEKRNSSYSNHQFQHKSNNKIFLNYKSKKNDFDKLLNKFNLTKKSFSNTETKLKVSFLENKELNKGNISLAMKNKQINNSSSLNSNIITRSNNFLKTYMTNSQSSNLNNNSKAPINYLSSSINGYSRNVHNKRDNEKKGEKERKYPSNSSSSFSSSSNFKYKKSRSNSNNSYGRKKYIFKINKNGKGVFSVDREEKLSKNIYDFEIIYNDSDSNESDRLISAEDKNKKILHFTFVESGKKIHEVKNLYISNDELIKNLHFYNNNNNNNSSDIKNKYRDYNGNESSHKEEKDMNVLEDKIKNLKEENFRRKYEITRIIDDIKYKKLHINEEESYSVEFVETNRLRGLYLQLLERQNELERDRNFYKKELEKLQNDIKNSTLPISEFFKEEKKIFLEREKEFYKNEKNYLKKKNELKKTIIELQSELDLTQERLIKEKELNESLNNIIKEHKDILDKSKIEQTNLDDANETKLKILNDECERFKKTIEEGKKEKDKLCEEIGMHLNKIEKMNEELTHLKQDDSFDKFRKIVLEKVNKTDGDIKNLAQLLELLTKELENKTIKENLISKQIIEVEQKYLKNKKLLSMSKKKLKKKKKKIDNMNEEISYLIKKNRNLIKTIRHLKLQNSDLTITEKRGKEDSIFKDEEKKKKNDNLIYHKTYNNKIKSNDTSANIAHFLSKNRKGQLKNNKRFASFSDESSLFLFNANIKKGHSFEESSNNVREPKHLSKFHKNCKYKIRLEQYEN